MSLELVVALWDMIGVALTEYVQIVQPVMGISCSELLRQSDTVQQQMIAAADQQLKRMTGIWTLKLDPKERKPLAISFVEADAAHGYNQLQLLQSKFSSFDN